MRRHGPSSLARLGALVDALIIEHAQMSVEAVMPDRSRNRKLAAMAWALCASAAGAQAPLHDAQYAEAGIKYGATVYAARCVTCHGTPGDAIGGVDLRSGRFRTVVIDRDLERVIGNGTPAGPGRRRST